MTVSSVTTANAAASASMPRQSLGQSDFIRLMTTQMTMQDPTEPTDNKDMIAQMAQFSSLSGIENVNATLKSIAGRLDALIAAQTPDTTA